MANPTNGTFDAIDYDATKNILDQLTAAYGWRFAEAEGDSVEQLWWQRQMWAAKDFLKAVDYHDRDALDRAAEILNQRIAEVRKAVSS